MHRFGWSRMVVAVLALGLVACGGRVDDGLATNDAILTALTDLPGAEPVTVESYGYDAGADESADDFFTEVRYEVVQPATADDVVARVASRLDGWDSEVTGEGDTVVATFRRGDARVAVTTWTGGFDVTVAAEGSRLDGTRLGLAP